MTDALELDALWDEFHRVVNMTSQELAAWLTALDVGEEAEPLPEHAGSPTGQHVLEILQKRRTDLTEDDINVMYGVVDTVTEETEQADRMDQTGPGQEHEAEETRRRHRLMTLGHDPLRVPS
ncbi:DUF3140 domain-containing protein [Streptomyces montanus]|uniref:DUF3140 domain-containing protein n=1 Tax=Streptomyces montanus TaxID=2580423 RepID=A0A5R9G3J4_9ACTN|nr:DUF3140 domain-containing protein [Streptomyces montanus]TLS48058.1 DUF3140 domain-containing protein [Streptomyces montanus]